MIIKNEIKQPCWFYIAVFSFPSPSKKRWSLNTFMDKVDTNPYYFKKIVSLRFLAPPHCGGSGGGYLFLPLRYNKIGYCCHHSFISGYLKKLSFYRHLKKLEKASKSFGYALRVLDFFPSRSIII